MGICHELYSRNALSAFIRTDDLLTSNMNITWPTYPFLFSPFFSSSLLVLPQVYGVYPLYMLYQAGKTQAEKGPIDVVTGDAYYTLEFSKLLNQEIDFHSLVSWLPIMGENISD